MLLQSPRAIGCVLEWRNDFGSGVYVCDTGRGLLRRKKDIFGGHFPILRACDGIDGDCAQVLCTNKVVERRGRRLLVERILLDGIPHCGQILLKYSLFRAQDGPVVSSHRDRREDHDDRNHDHQFEEGESFCPEPAPVYAKSPRHEGKSYRTDLSSTNLHSSFRRFQFPWKANTRQIHCALPSYGSQHHLEWRAIPTRASRSSDRPESFEGIALSWGPGW